MANQRLNQIGTHVSGNYPNGMLQGEVAIITGKEVFLFHPYRLQDTEGIGVQELLKALESVRLCCTQMKGRRSLLAISTQVRSLSYCLSYQPYQLTFSC